MDGGGHGDSHSRTIFARNIAYTATEEDFQAVPAFASNILVKLPKDPSGQSRGFGFIEFATAEECQKALAEIPDGQFDLHGRPCYIGQSQPNGGGGGRGRGRGGFSQGGGFRGGRGGYGGSGGYRGGRGGGYSNQGGYGGGYSNNQGYGNQGGYQGGNQGYGGQSSQGYGRGGYSNNQGSYGGGQQQEGGYGDAGNFGGQY